VVTHEAILPVKNPVRVNGIPCTPPARCTLDLARRFPRMRALPLLDAALRAGVSGEDLVAEAGRHRGLRGVRQVRELIRLADPRAECVQESQLRLVLVDSGLPVPEPQVWVDDRYRIDLAYRHRRVGIEYDGRSHWDQIRLAADRVRMNWLDSRGWTMRYFTARDLYDNPAQIVATVRAALE
jgi:very-short-patch-repair endonuclease